jgi:hypothetical protein
VIGAGIAGLSIARALGDTAEITVFEKSRGAGGRMSTRRVEGWHFDHGTQFFTVRNPRFKAFLQPHLDEGSVAEWRGRVVWLSAGEAPTERPWLEPHYVPVPGMNALAKRLAAGVALRTGVEVAPLAEPGAGPWSLYDTAGEPLGDFDWVLSTAPSPQSVRLLDRALPADAPLRAARYLPCFSLMLGFDGAWPKDWIAAKVRGSAIEWLASQSSRPGRPASTALVAQASAEWSAQNLERDPAEAQRELEDALRALGVIEPRSARHSALHRWRYALLDESTAAPGPMIDSARRIAATGDWCRASRVEDAWLAGEALAEQLVPLLRTETPTA